jgi:hypothetical protein
MEENIWLPFYEGTLIPRETVENKKEAVNRVKTRGIPTDQVSYFWRPERYESERFVCRSFCPGSLYDGRFAVYTSIDPMHLGSDRVASRSVFEEH